ncbi:MAG: transposase [Bacteroidetes bacterium]|nr:transposase [Bacteroidota bacterium]
MVFSILVSLPFLGYSTVHSLTRSVMEDYIQARKDTFYRLKNNPKVCWRSILWMFSVKFRKVAEQQGRPSANRVRCLVFDDTVISKTGKYIEKVSRVWDHVVNRCVLGYKLLLMGYWDGTSLTPLDFSLHRERGKNDEKPYGLKKREYKKQYRKKRQPGTHACDRDKETDMTKIESALRMFRRAITQGFQVDYVLMDSWFTCEAFIHAVCKVKSQVVHLIGMYKNAKARFLYCGQLLTYSQIRNMIGKPKRCRKLRLYYLETCVELNGIPLKLFFSKQGKNGKWKVLVTTHTEITFIKMIEIYQIRWTIEVFFKESKQLLGLGKCQSNDFDAQIADTTLTMIQHILLTLRYRFDTYESKGELFRSLQENMVQLRLNERLWGLFIELLNIIDTLFDQEDVTTLLEKILTNDWAYEKISRLLNDDQIFRRVA